MSTHSLLANLAAASLALVGVAVAPASAVPVTRTFRVTILAGATGGPFAGQTFDGRIGYDDDAPMVDPHEPSVVFFELTSFEFAGFFGRSFALADLSSGRLTQFGGNDFVDAFSTPVDHESFQFDPGQNAGHLFRYFTEENASGGPFANGFVGDVELPEPSGSASVAILALGLLLARRPD